MLPLQCEENRGVKVEDRDGEAERLSWEVKLESEGLPQAKDWEKRRIDSGYRGLYGLRVCESIHLFTPLFSGYPPSLGLC